MVRERGFEPPSLLGTATSKLRVYRISPLAHNYTITCVILRGKIKKLKLVIYYVRGK